MSDEKLAAARMSDASRRREGELMARRALDKYRTPPWMTEAFKESFPDVRGDILIDPCAGDCRMAAALASRFGWAVTNDISATRNRGATTSQRR